MSESVATIRSGLGLTQGELAELLGVHYLTISKWERGKLVPSAYYAALLHAFGRAAENGGVRYGRRAVEELRCRGFAAALYYLLNKGLGGA